MSNIQHYIGGQSLSPRDTRRLDRTLTGHQVAREIRQSKSDVEVDVAIGKIVGETMVAGAGMQAVMQVAVNQQTYEQVAPSASGRLALIADNHAINAAEVSQDLHHRLRRI